MSQAVLPGGKFEWGGISMQNDSFKSLGIPMVGKVRTMESFIQQEYGHAVSEGGIRFRNQLQAAGEAYGGMLHEIQGDGNCLTTAFSTSLLYALNGTPDLIDRFDRILVGLDKHPDIANVRQIIERLKGKNDSERDTILANDKMMTAFSNVIRHLARQKLPELGHPYNVLLDVMVPEESGREIEIPCIGGLCQTLQLRADVIVLRTDYDDFKLEQYPDNSRAADLIIIRKAAHYISLAPKVDTAKKTETLGKDRISGNKAPPIDKPVTVENSSRKIFIVLTIILALGAFYYLSNFRNPPKIQ